MSASVVFAQDPAQGGGRRWQTGARGGAQMGGPRLLFRSDVQADLQLTNEQKDKLDALRQSMGGGRGEGRRQRGEGQRRERPDRAQMEARRAEQAKQIQAILTADQTKRLKEIQIQLQGDLALASPEVQTELGFTSAQKSQVASLQEKYREAMQSVWDKVQAGSLDRAQARASTEQNSKVLGGEYRKLLSQTQATKFAAMSGKPFKADETPRR
ncbi:MAG TPA: hypothetical protein VGE01_08810 [Fimbriimonas sp.]